MKSNGLCPAVPTPGSGPPAQSATAPETPPIVHDLDRWLLAVGLCVLAVWIIRRLGHPRKLSLRRTPGRPNSLLPVHILVVVAIWLGLQLLVPQADHKAHLVWLLICQAVWLAVCLVVAGRTFRYGLSRGLGLSMRHWLYDSGRGVIGYLGVFPVCIALFWMMRWIWPATPEDTHALLRLLPTVGPAWKILAILSAVVLAPLAEEVFFRGLLQSIVRKYTMNPWVAILGSSVFFALAHGTLWRDMPALFALSVALGYNYERCGRLYPSILIHAIFNAVSVAAVLVAT